jgi:hypothetical protein
LIEPTAEFAYFADYLRFSQYRKTKVAISELFLQLSQIMTHNAFPSFLENQANRMGYPTQIAVSERLGLGPSGSGKISKLYSGDQIPKVDFFQLWYARICTTDAERLAFLESYARYWATQIDPIRGDQLTISATDPLSSLPYKVQDAIRYIIHETMHGSPAIGDSISAIVAACRSIQQPALSLVAEAPPPWKSSSKDGLPDPHHHDDTDRKKTDRNQ